MIGKILRKIRFGMFRILGKIDPKIIARIMYFEAHHKRLNLKNPQNLDEKINWMKFNTDTSIWTRLADKYMVRDYIREKGLASTLNDIYGVYRNADEIDLTELPTQFVIKTTNGSSGMQVLIVKDKSTLDWGKAKSQLNQWLSYTPPFTIAEPHYAGIEPRLIVEKLLHDSGQKSLIDYKFHCFNGHVESCLVCSDRVNGQAAYCIYNLNWEKIHWGIVDHYSKAPDTPRPKSLEQMIEYSKILSKGFPYVRIDWYEIDGKPVFSEMTFTPAGGYNKTISMRYLEHMGKLTSM